MDGMLGVSIVNESGTMLDCWSSRCFRTTKSSRALWRNPVCELPCVGQAAGSPVLGKEPERPEWPEREVAGRPEQRLGSPPGAGAAWEQTIDGGRRHE
jgi:hypothetical protein